MHKAIRLVQISDCHLPGNPQQPYRGASPHGNLKALLQKVTSFAPDLLLATGDLSEDASPQAYRALQESFAALAVPVMALPGNHDDAGAVARSFPGSPVDEVAVSEHGCWQIFRLNSCVQGKPEGRLAGHILEQLEKVLQREPRRPKVVALHHQPVPVGSPWIDRYRLLEPEAFLQLIDQAPGVRAVVWGHIHQGYAADRNGIAMLGGPSSVINSLPGAHKFTPDSRGPACRWLELREDETVRTGIMVA